MQNESNWDRMVWANPGIQLSPRVMTYLTFTGILLGIITGALIAVFRIVKLYFYEWIIAWNAPDHTDFFTICIWFLIAASSGVIVCILIKNPAIRHGGDRWIFHAITAGQPHVITKILAPKFAAILLVLGCGASVGSEGPSIQMGAATALAMKQSGKFRPGERKFFVLGGCAAGLSAAFSAPFAGICYVYEVMHQRMSRTLFIFLLSAGFGVFISTSLIFGLDVMLPLPPGSLPTSWNLWWVFPLAISGSLVGIIYAFLLEYSSARMAKQKLIPLTRLPLLAFAGTFLIILFYPAISGEGLTIFGPILENKTTLMFLLVFLGAKLLFTAFCYGTFIPAGVMVPLLAVGGVTGAIFYDIMNYWGIIDLGYRSTCIAMGMVATFAAAEQAPLTAVVLVAEMTGSWQLLMGMLLVAAIAVFISRKAGSRPV